MKISVRLPDKICSRINILLAKPHQCQPVVQTRSNARYQAANYHAALALVIEHHKRDSQPSLKQDQHAQQLASAFAWQGNHSL